MFRQSKIWFRGLSKLGKAGVVTGLILGSTVVGSALSSPPSPTSHTPTGPAKTATTCTSSVSTAIETQSVPFDKTTVNDPNTAQGKSYIQTAGVNGVKTITYKVTAYTPTGCQPDTKQQTSEVVTTAPVTEVTAVGTYVAPAPPTAPTCSNGSYVNSDGVTVCSPSANPNGATAICADGSYSYSLHRSGTCSHHGGVTQWL